MSSNLIFLPTGPNPNPNPNSDSSDNKGKRVINLKNGSEVIHIPRFVPWDQAWAWYEYLDQTIPWTRPLIHVFGKSCVQEIACFFPLLLSGTEEDLVLLLKEDNETLIRGYHSCSG